MLQHQLAAGAVEVLALLLAHGTGRTVLEATDGVERSSGAFVGGRAAKLRAGRQVDGRWSPLRSIHYAAPEHHPNTHRTTTLPPPPSLPHTHLMPRLRVGFQGG